MALLLILAACSGSSRPEASNQDHDGHEASATCAPSGTTLRIRAIRNLFDRKCLAAPVDQPFTIAFDNKDSAEAHNIAIFEEDPAEDPDTKVLFRSAQFRGPKTVSYQIRSLPAGEYHFHCDVHPVAMFGVFRVET